MLIKKGPFEISFGKGVGHVLEDLLLTSKERLWVISPWVSSKYADILVKKAEKGIDVKLLTSNDFSNKAHKKAVNNMVDFRRKINRYPAYVSVILAFLFLGFSTISLPWLALTIIPIFVFIKYGIVFVAKPKFDEFFVIDTNNSVLGIVSKTRSKNPKFDKVFFKNVIDKGILLRREMTRNKNNKKESDEI